MQKLINDFNNNNNCAVEWISPRFSATLTHAAESAWRGNSRDRNRDIQLVICRKMVSNERKSSYKMTLPYYRWRKISHIYYCCCHRLRHCLCLRHAYMHTSTYSPGDVRARTRGEIFETFPFHAATHGIKFYVKYFDFSLINFRIHRFHPIYRFRAMQMRRVALGMRSSGILLRYFHIKCRK